MPFILSWGIAGGAAGLLGIVQSGVVPRPLGCSRWIRAQWDLGGRQLGELAANSGFNQFVMYAAGAIGGLGAAGWLPMAGRCSSVHSMLPYRAPGWSQFPEQVRTLRKRPQMLVRVAVLISLGLGALAALYAIVLVAFGDVVGPLLLGETWPNAQPLVIPLRDCRHRYGVVGRCDRDAACHAGKQAQLSSQARELRPHRSRGDAGADARGRYRWGVGYRDREPVERANVVVAAPHCWTRGASATCGTHASDRDRARRKSRRRTGRLTMGTPVNVLYVAGFGRSGSTLLGNVLGAYDTVFWGPRVSCTCSGRRWPWGAGVAVGRRLPAVRYGLPFCRTFALRAYGTVIGKPFNDGSSGRHAWFRHTLASFAPLRPV